MNFDPVLDKRQNKRYLCDEHFSSCQLQLNGSLVETTAIDFSHEGMGVFSNDHIPDSGRYSLTLVYDNPALSKQFHKLPCTIVYCNLTEVGSHCGIRFELEQLSAEDRSSLEEIEQSLSQLDDPEDRYHLFGGE